MKCKTSFQSRHPPLQSHIQTENILAYLKITEQFGSAWDYKETKPKHNFVGFTIPEKPHFSPSQYSYTNK